MNKEELVQEVAKKAKVTQKEAANVINELMELVKEQQELVVTPKLVRLSTFLLRLLRYSQLVKNSKKLLTNSLQTLSLKTVLVEGGFFVDIVEIFMPCHCEERASRVRGLGEEKTKSTTRSPKKLEKFC